MIAVSPQHSIRLGLTGCLAISLIASFLASLPELTRHGLGWLPLAVALGLVAGNLWPALPTHGRAGLNLARGPLMRAGIALYGLHIGVDALASVGWSGPLMAILIVTSTLGLAVMIGNRLGLDRHVALLVGAGSGICGAAAIAATDSVLGARARHVSAAVAAVVVFGTLGMYLLPLLYPLLGLSASAFGLWLGLTIHELGHVVAAAGAVGPEAAASALVEKMLRVMLLAPAVVFVALYNGRASGNHTHGVRLPPFLWGFVGAIAINASGLLPTWLHDIGVFAANALLAIGLAALGASTRFADIRAAGLRVWILAALLAAHLLASGFILVVFLSAAG